MLFINRLLWVGLLAAGLAAATTSHAGTQLFDASWTVKAFGNELSGGLGDSEFYSATGIPLGIVCNPSQPRCHFDSTPSDGMGKWQPLGGSVAQALHCGPWSNWGGKGTTTRPAKGATPTKAGNVVPPLYRNDAFFTRFGMPNDYSCIGTSTDGYGGKGLVQQGVPVTGRWSAQTTGGQNAGFSFTAAPAAIPTSGPKGLRVTGGVGEVGAIYPYVYSYTYATFRNNQGIFGNGAGPGDFNLPYALGGTTVASINVKQGPAKFGGTMTMLGALTTKVCFYRNQGCSLGQNNWRYDAVGTSASTSLGVVTAGDKATYKAYYYHTALMQLSTVNVEGLRFPWTTGSVTLTAVGRGPHKTVHYHQGFDNRTAMTPTSGTGTIGTGTLQLVSPVLTRWIQPALNFETGGIAILRIKFLPEPQGWMMLVVGISFLGVAKRMRGR
jgi:hypothetical protein